MKKQYAQDLNKKRDKLITDLENTEETIKKRFNMILSDYSSYMSDDHKMFCINSSVHDLPINRMLEIMIQTEANYVKTNGNQLDIFN